MEPWWVPSRGSCDGSKLLSAKGCDSAKEERPGSLLSFRTRTLEEVG